MKYEGDIKIEQEGKEATAYFWDNIAREYRELGTYKVNESSLKIGDLSVPFATMMAMPYELEKLKVERVE